MGYYLQALIGKSDLLKTKPQAFPSEYRVELAQGFTMILVTEELSEEVGEKFSANEEAAPGGFSMLTDDLVAWARQLSKLTPVAYIEAEYFGGTGGQSAIVLDKARTTLGPLSGEIGPINQALRLLGAKVLSARDEFEAVGLNRKRHMEDWIEISNESK